MRNNGFSELIVLLITSMILIVGLVYISNNRDITPEEKFEDEEQAVTPMVSIAPTTSKKQSIREIREEKIQMKTLIKG